MANSGLDIRILYLVRNPLERITSHYLMAMANEWNLMTLDEGLDPRIMAYTRYSYQLSFYEAEFLPEKILAISADDLIHDYSNAMQRIMAHFEIDASVPVRHIFRHGSDRYKATLIQRELTARGHHDASAAADGPWAYLSALQESERESILENVDRLYQPAPSQRQQIHDELRADMIQLRYKYGIDVAGWGFG